MKYLVNKETKEHRFYSGEYFEDHLSWKVVEADEEGWVPWEGGECPLPDFCMCEVQLADGEMPAPFLANWLAWKIDIGPGTITHYRPILETAEKKEPRRHGRTIVHIPESQQSVFDRLKSAIAASESIPAIIAEIDALLPEGYFVSKTLTDIQESIGTHLEAAEDMSDWRNWRAGDLVQATEGTYGYTYGNTYKIKGIDRGIVYTEIDDKGSLTNGWTPRYFRFHSRPAKVTE